MRINPSVFLALLLALSNVLAAQAKVAPEPDPVFKLKKANPGTVKLDGQVPSEKAEKVPGILEEKNAEVFEGRSPILLPPGNRQFRIFNRKRGEVAPEFQIEDDTHVDIMENLDEPFLDFKAKRLRDEDFEIQVRILIYKETLTAGVFRLFIDGNLKSGGGGKGGAGGVGGIVARVEEFWRGGVEFIADEPDLDADIDRDGDVEDEEDEKNEEEIGTIVIANIAGVYDDKKEPARRREIIIRNKTGITVRLERSSASVELYKTAKKGNELFGKIKAGKDKGKPKLFLSLKPNTYFLAGGPKPSIGIQKDFLIVRKQDNAASGIADVISITVIFSNIRAHNRLNKINNVIKKKIGPKIIYDGFKAIKDNLEHDKLGCQTNLQPLLNKFRPGVNGVIQIEGEIRPSNLLGFDPNTKISTGFINPSEDRSRASFVKFGFIFRRFVDAKIYIDGRGKADLVKKSNDDADRKFQDVDPVLFNKELLIVDVDIPSGFVVPVDVPRAGLTKQFFVHIRDNFIEYNTFSFQQTTVKINKKKVITGIAERCSKKLLWSFTTDIALGTKNESVFILDVQNDGKKTNEVLSASIFLL